MPEWLNEWWFRVKYPFKLITFACLDAWVKRKNVKTKPKTMLIFRLDLLGDYLLCQKFFAFISERGRFEGYSLTLCCNSIVAELAQELNGSVFDNFIFINRPLFLKSLNYRKKVLEEIRSRGFEVVVCPMHTRQFLLESLVFTSGAPVRIGASQIGHHMMKWQKWLSAKFYTEIIETQGDPTFEFYRNRMFFCKLTVQDLPVHNNFLSVKSGWLNAAPDVEYVLFAPGASVPHRQWPTHAFAELANRIYTQLGYPIYVVGSQKEKPLFLEIKEKLPREVVFIDTTGGLSLMQVFGLISKASLLVSNESAPVHMAAMVGNPTICLSNGNHFRRWNPYPQLVSPYINTLYPDSFFELDRKGQMDAHTFGSNIPMNAITVDQVWAEVKRILIHV